ncbi:MAG: VOC family protein [SAR202 cluster bacterium]|nr:VOC family protein [SAR202 cluster bacterium]
MQKITPFLWLNDQAEEAAEFYTSIFRDSRILNVTRSEASDKMSGRPAGTAMTVAFQIGGQEFIALNGGPTYSITPAISFVVNCADQQEVDYYWEKLTQGGGQEVQCGWLTDKYGLSWQVVPAMLWDLLHDPDHTRCERVMAALLPMKKIDIAGLERAASNA